MYNNESKLTTRNTFPKPTNPPFDEWKIPTCTIKNNILTISSPFNFSFSFPRETAGIHAGFDKKTIYANSNNNNEYSITGTNYILPFSEPWGLAGCVIKFTSKPYTATNRIFIKDSKQWSNPKAMSLGILKDFSYVFNKYAYKNGRIAFQMKPYIHTINFLNGFHCVLGFERVQYVGNVKNQPIFKANYPPQLNRGINNMYIYSSICTPIRVGGDLIPLLRSIWLEKKEAYQVGEVINVEMRNPMYLPVSSSSINNIETNIRSDSGYLFRFIEGSVTSITLHFMKTGE
jgi:hypothetical protein